VTIIPQSSEQVWVRVAERLGLDPAVHGAFTTEALSESLRRAASVLCPATPGEIVNSVRDALEPLDQARGPDRDELATLLDLLIATGDLLELRQSGEHASRLLYLAPPSYLTKMPGQYLLLGVRPEGRRLLNEELSGSVEREGHLRFAHLDAAAAPELLKAAGLQELRPDRWLKLPRAIAAAEYLSAFRLRLDAALAAGSVDGLEIIDTSARLNYYRGRWRSLASADSGDFVGRRPQAYGAAAWCFARVLDGRPMQLLDLPAEDRTAFARDEAWRLQAAIDADAGSPQRYRLRSVAGEDASRVLDLFSPLPAWAARQLDFVGTPVARSSGALISYRLHDEAIAPVRALLTDMLWMQADDAGGPE
jgi:hypothetical protein